MGRVRGALAPLFCAGSPGRAPPETGHRRHSDRSAASAAYHSAPLGTESHRPQERQQRVRARGGCTRARAADTGCQRAVRSRPGSQSRPRPAAAGDNTSPADSGSSGPARQSSHSLWIGVSREATVSSGPPTLLLLPLPAAPSRARSRAASSSDRPAPAHFLSATA